MGFLTEIVNADELEHRVDALSGQLAGMAPIALLGIKKHLNLIARGQIDTQDIEAAVLKSESSNDIIEGAAAWKQKRPPQFSGT
jgi:1,4-dihydroxy-2-naphthoyl-CoA synthase